MTTNKPVALVTGANKGIGYAIAAGLSDHGYAVGIGARDAARRADAVTRLRESGHDVFDIALDVTDDASVAAAAAQIQQQHGRLDVLVNNAGINGGWNQAPTTVELDTIRTTLETNVLGAVRVTNALIPLLREAPAGRIVNISSSGASLTWQSSDEASGWVSAAYAPSKTMLNALTIQYAKELRDTNIKINAVDPGYTATDFTNNYGDRTPEEAAAIAVNLATIGPEGPTGGFFSQDGAIAW